MTRTGPKPRDITDMNFGLLHALHPTGEKTSKGIIWECRCRCGGMVRRTVAELTRTRYTLKSCGCARRGVRSVRFKGCGDLSGQKWANIKNGAKRRKYPFEITLEYAWELFLAQNKRCAFTGVKLSMNPTSMKAGASTASLDRIDSSKGYVVGNVHWVHTTINLMKQTLSSDEFIAWCQRVSSSAYAYGAEFGKGTVANPHHF